MRKNDGDGEKRHDPHHVRDRRRVKDRREQFGKSLVERLRRIEWRERVGRTEVRHFEEGDAQKSGEPSADHHQDRRDTAGNDAADDARGECAKFLRFKSQCSKNHCANGIEAEVDGRQSGDDRHRAGGGEPLRFATAKRGNADDQHDHGWRESQHACALSEHRGGSESEEADVGRSCGGGADCVAGNGEQRVERESRAQDVADRLRTGFQNHVIDERVLNEAVGRNDVDVRFRAERHLMRRRQMLHFFEETHARFSFGGE